MKIPRNVKGKELIKRLQILGYEVTRQVGSHVRLSTEKDGKHSVTIPNHNPIKVGTLSAIMTQLAIHHKLSKEEILKLVFKK